MDKFIFRQDYWKCLDNLDSIAKAEAIEDIINYALYQKEPSSDVGIILINAYRKNINLDRELLKGVK